MAQTRQARERFLFRELSNVWAALAWATALIELHETSLPSKAEEQQNKNEN